MVGDCCLVWKVFWFSGGCGNGSVVFDWFLGRYSLFIVGGVEFWWCGFVDGFWLFFLYGGCVFGGGRNLFYGVVFGKLIFVSVYGYF